MLIILVVALSLSAWISYEIYRAPLMNEEEDINDDDDDDDPTTTFWHEKN